MRSAHRKPSLSQNVNRVQSRGKGANKGELSWEYKSIGERGGTKRGSEPLYKRQEGEKMSTTEEVEGKRVRTHRGKPEGRGIREEEKRNHPLQVSSV